MKKFVMAFLLGLVLVSGPSFVVASSQQLFPKAKSVQFTQQEQLNYLLPLGMLKKLDQSWAPEYFRWVEGKVSVETLQLSGQKSLQAYFVLLKQAIEKQQDQFLFICQGIECGSSVQWANHIFNNRQLSGLDKEQFVVVVRSKQPALSYRVYYLVRRGNRRVYLNTVVIDPISQSLVLDNTLEARVIYHQLQHLGYIELQGLHFDINGDFNGDSSQQVLDQIVEFLNSFPQLNVYLVGYSNRVDVTKAFNFSDRAAMQVLEALQEKKPNLGQRVKTFAAGRMVPMRVKKFSKFETVELVLVP